MKTVLACLGVNQTFGQAARLVKTEPCQKPFEKSGCQAGTIRTRRNFNHLQRPRARSRRSRTQDNGAQANELGNRQKYVSFVLAFSRYFCKLLGIGLSKDIAGIDMLKLPHCNSSGLRSGTALLLGKITVLMPTTQMWLLASYNDECSLRHLHGLPEGCGRETQNRQV